MRWKAGVSFLLCAASAAALAAGNERPETFFIRATSGGREATIKVPVGAVSSFFATSAEALTNYAGPEVEAMRLSGDVRIDVIGNGQPIHIKADRVVLELTADDVGGHDGSMPVSGSRHLRSSRIIEEGASTQTFLGNVVYTLQTSSGAMQITADRVEHTGRIEERPQRREGV